MHYCFSAVASITRYFALNNEQNLVSVTNTKYSQRINTNIPIVDDL